MRSRGRIYFLYSEGSMDPRSVTEARQRVLLMRAKGGASVDRVFEGEVSMKQVLGCCLLVVGLGCVHPPGLSKRAKSKPGGRGEKISLRQHRINDLVKTQSLMESIRLSA